MSTEITVVEHQGLVPRHEEVRQRILSIKDDLVSRSLELGKLLREARDNAYHTHWGYTRFGAWIEEGSGLDLSERSAYGLIQVIERSEALGIPEEELKRVKVSKLRAVLSLPEDVPRDTVVGLLKEAETLPLSTVQDMAGVLRGTEYVVRSLRLPRSFYDGQWKAAMERVRRLYGNTVAGGETVDITESRAVEMLVADWMSQPEQVEAVNDEYLKLCYFVHERDGWQCRNCKSRNNLHAHHVKFRSQGGEDTMENLITLCNVCHDAIHVTHTLVIIGNNASQNVVFRVIGESE